MRRFGILLYSIAQKNKLGFPNLFFALLIYLLFKEIVEEFIQVVVQPFHEVAADDDSVVVGKI